MRGLPRLVILRYSEGSSWSVRGLSFAARSFGVPQDDVGALRGPTSSMSMTATQFDEQMMRRAIRLAMRGRGRVEPNPMVGCVIVKDGRVIGEGFHAKFGGPHAERAALASCTESAGGTTAYV